MQSLRQLWAIIQRYVRHDDPLVAACNLLAVVVAWNQPFYPLYVYWSVSPVVWPTYFAFFSTPFFLAVPLVSRLDGRLGRAMLPLVGVGNTMVCTKVFGVPAGAEVFLIACALIPAVFFRATEAVWRYGLIVLPFAVYFGLRGRYGGAFHTYSSQEYASFFTLNALSAATLTVFVGLMAANALRADSSPSKV